ncbi:MAG: hypothetical protein JWN91_70, partial [Nocardioides sp.]|nr:hypothetical protein [Nocardioides sp.]
VVDEHERYRYRQRHSQPRLVMPTPRRLGQHELWLDRVSVTYCWRRRLRPRHKVTLCVR